MNCLRIRTVLAAAIIAGFPGLAAAQFPPPPRPAGSPPPTVQDRWPEPAKPPQSDRAQTPAPKAAPKRPPAHAKPAPASEEPLQPAARRSAPRGPATVVTCGGVFGKDATHLKLAIRFDSRNIVFGQVDGPEGSKINATILYPNDPTRRLEVIWNNEAARADISLVAINGKSQWTAPKGLKLGLPIAAVEKINGRPFKMSGFGADGSAAVAGWEGGALASLPGGCKVGLRLIADSKAPDGARSAVAGDKELLSNDPGLRALKPTIGEILIGY